MGQLTAPFPYFGGKRRAAELAWARFGDVPNYVEPFCGSCAVLLARPHAPRVETVNDIDGLLVNFWRAVAFDPDAVTKHVLWPVTELDLHARHKWLLGHRDSITEQLRADPEFYDAKAAGWWCWGANAWIGSGWGDKEAIQLPHLTSAGVGLLRSTMSPEEVTCWLESLSSRMARVRITCGDAKRVLADSVTTHHGDTAVFLDPPYDAEGHDKSMYVSYGDVASKAAEWAFENGDNPKFRIALCGYAGEHKPPKGWTVSSWKARKGYGSQANTERERIWFSPHCLPVSLFDLEDSA